MRPFASALFIGLCAVALLTGCATTGRRAPAPRTTQAADAPGPKNVEVSGSIQIRASHYSGPTRFRAGR
ncbi:MAG: hypothetical protein GWP08_21575 [Nitrospiraceae bacterium]|nr:hypothetical protein [Nitrospiraceae bacterium]